MDNQGTTTETVVVLYPSWLKITLVFLGAFLGLISLFELIGSAMHPNVLNILGLILSIAAFVLAILILVGVLKPSVKCLRISYYMATLIIVLYIIILVIKLVVLLAGDNHKEEKSTGGIGLIVVAAIVIAFLIIILILLRKYVLQVSGQTMPGAWQWLKSGPKAMATGA